MSDLKHFKDLSPEDKKIVEGQLQEAAKKQMEQDIAFFTEMGMTSDEVKVGAQTFKTFLDEKLKDQKYSFYKSPMARRMFIAGTAAKKGTTIWSSYSAKK